MEPMMAMSAFRLRIGVPTRRLLQRHHRPRFPQRHPPYNPLLSPLQSPPFRHRILLQMYRQRHLRMCHQRRLLTYPQTSLQELQLRCHPIDLRRYRHRSLLAIRHCLLLSFQRQDPRDPQHSHLLICPRVCLRSSPPVSPRTSLRIPLRRFQPWFFPISHRSLRHSFRQRCHLTFPRRHQLNARSHLRQARPLLQMFPLICPRSRLQMFRRRVRQDPHWVRPLFRLRFS